MTVASLEATVFCGGLASKDDNEEIYMIDLIDQVFRKVALHYSDNGRRTDC